MIDSPILLTGGTGFIGNKTLELLSNNFPNLQIFSVYRSANKPETIYDNVEWVHCNLIEDNLIILSHSLARSSVAMSEGVCDLSRARRRGVTRVPSRGAFEAGAASLAHSTHKSPYVTG